MLDKQVLYHVSHASSPLLAGATFVIFGQVLLFLPRAGFKL
jgi:hypothetical protein